MSDVHVVAVVPVAGRVNQRARDSASGGSALLSVHDVPLVVHAVRRLRAAASVDEIVVLPEHVSDMDGLRLDARILTGSLADTTRDLAATASVLLVHDPLRAFVPVDVVDRVVQAVLAHRRPVVPVLPCSDTVKRIDPSGVVMDTPDRSGLRVAQAPVGYPAELIADGSVVPGTVPAGALTVAGDPRARRVADAVDLAMLDGGMA
jgi:2-C-methyl-D-erythritol 4-phosphate cytidylyltransferase